MASENQTNSASNKNAKDVSQIDDRVRALTGSVPQLGTVVRTGVGSYDCLVALGEKLVPCLVATTMEGTPFGYFNSDLPKEGSNVIVVMGLDTWGIGYIIGCVGTDALKVDDNSDFEPLKQGATCFEGPTRHTEEIYTDPIERKDGLSYYAGDFRLADVFPGEYVRMNEHGVGIDCDTLSASLRGGSAKISASRVDNTIEIVASNFRKYDVSGFTKVDVDAGCITEESLFAEYVGERKGGAGLKAGKKKHEDDEKYDDRPVGKYRLRTFKGYLGGVFSAFLSKPEKNTEETEEFLTAGEHEPVNTGLMHLNVNDNGKVLFRSAGGFALERSDRIPVPIRIREPGDPAGIKAEDIDKEDELAFDLPEDDQGSKSPYYVPLALADKMVYDYRMAYDRFLEHVTDGDSADAKNDFYLQKEEDIEEIEDDAGIPGRKVTPDFLEKNKGRRSGIYNLPDGSIILRDAWGSEIIMSGGNITINTPGNVHVNPGHSAVFTAGDDIVLKARNSIDMETTEHDINIHADKNVKVAAGSDDSPGNGGILLESFAQGNAVNYEDLQGEDVALEGIMFKANNSQISVLGKNHFVGASESVRIVTGAEEKDKRSGSFNIATGDFGLAAEEGMTFANKKGGVTIADGSTSLVGESVSVVAQDGVTFATKSQIGVPIWLDMKIDMASAYMKQLENYTKKESKDALNDPINMIDMLSEHIYSHRTSEQQHTLEGTEFTDRPDSFTLYQPYWTVLAELDVGTMHGVETEKWKDHTVDGEYPWPGTDAVENGYYAKLEHEDDETLNQKKITIKVKSVDSDGNESEDDLDILCSKEYDEVTGSEEDGGDDRPKIKLENLSEFIVPVITKQEEKDNKNKKQDKNGNN